MLMQLINSLIKNTFWLSDNEYGREGKTEKETEKRNEEIEKGKEKHKKKEM
jgi:hypothetical protein